MVLYNRKNIKSILNFMVGLYKVKILIVLIELAIITVVVVVICNILTLQAQNKGMVHLHMVPI